MPLLGTASPFDDLLNQLGPAAQAPPPQTPKPPDPQPPPSTLGKTLDEMLRSERAPNTRDVRRSEVDAQELNGDRASEIQRLSKKLGVPESVVEKDFEAIQKRARLTSSSAATIAQQAPRLAEWVAKDKFKLAAAREDLNDLTFVEGLLQTGSKVYGAVGAGVMSFSEGVWGLLALGGDVYASPGSRALAEFARGSSEVAAGMAERQRGDQSHMGLLERGIYSGIESVVSAAPSLGLGLAAGPGAALAMMGMQTTGSSYSQARGEGLGVGSALGYATVQGIIEMATEKIPMSRLLEDIATKTPLIQAVVRQMAPELVGENVATVLQDLNDWNALPSNANKTFADYLAERPSAAALTTISTITMIGLNTTMAHASAKLLGDLTAVSENSKLRERDPGQFADLIDHLAQDSPASTLYARVEDWVKYWQGKNLDPKAEAIKLTGDANAYDAAVATNGDLAIPVGQYAAQLAPTEHNTFFSKELRVQPEMPNVREAAEAEAQTAELMEAIQTSVEDAAARREAPEATTSPIRAALVAQTLADPGFQAMVQREQADAETVANVYAAGIEAVITNLGRRAGEDPLDILSRHGLTIGAEGTAAALRAVQAAQEAAPTAQPTETPAEAPSAPEAGAPPAEPAPGQAPEPGAITLEQGPGPTLPQLAVAPARVQQGRLVLSTRVPTAVGSPAMSDVLKTDAEAIASRPKLVKAIADKMRPLGQVLDAEKQADDATVNEAFVQRIARNLRWLHDTYPKAWRDRAKLWYVGAHRIARNLAIEHETTQAQATAVLAVLSPQKDWYQNVSLAERVMAGYNKAERDNPVFTPELFAHYVSRVREGLPAKLRKIEKREGKAAAQAARKAIIENLRWQREHIQGVAWSDLQVFDQSILLRAIDETTTSPSYHVILPEGEKGELARTAKGQPSKVTWGTYQFIANAISVMRDGSVETINDRVGYEHKVRSFFNNISDPWDDTSVTIDTHAIGAAVLEPISGVEPVAKLAMSGPADNLIGISGTNPLFAEAYFRVARELGILPRELQSITWEAARGLFTRKEKQEGVAAQVRNSWQDVARGTLSEEQFRARLLTIAGGIARPAWADTPPRVALDESSLRRGDVLPGDPGLPAGRGDAGEGAPRAARGPAPLNDGPVVPRADVLAAGRAQPILNRTTAATRALDRFRDGATRVYEGRRDRGAGEKRNLDVESVWEPNGEFADAFAAAGFGVPTLFELRPTLNAARQFHRLISAAKAKIENGAQVNVYSVEEYRTMKLFATPDGNAGFAIKSDGDLVSAFNYNTGKERIVNGMLALGVQLGGTKLDAFDTTLPDIYAINGFKVVRREPWNDTMKPAGWGTLPPEGGVPDVRRQTEAGAAERGRREVVSSPAQARPEAVEAVQGIAAAYTEPLGLGVKDYEYAPVEQRVSWEIADIYDTLPADDSANPAVIAAYEAMAAETQAQWDHAIAAGMTFEPWTQDGQPYKNAAEMTADVRANQHLWFYTGGEDHPFLGEKTRDATGLTLNDKFRAIHDFYAHAAGGYGFGPRGEENAWRVHSQMFSPDARRAMTTETRGQNSWVNFGAHNYNEDGSYKHVPVTERPYATQKVALLPDRFIFPEATSPFMRFNNGRPDVVYMEFDPAALKTGPVTLYQSPIPVPTSASWAYSRLQKAVELAKQEKASGRDWKNIIKGSKLGINQEEYLLTDVSDLDDRAQYTRQEVLDYLRTNQVAVAYVVLDQESATEQDVAERADIIYEQEVQRAVLDAEDRFPVEVSPVEVGEREDADGDTVYVVDGDEYVTKEEADEAADKLYYERIDFAQQEQANEAANSVSMYKCEELAREELSQEWDDNNRGPQFTGYTIDETKSAEPDSYREVFLQAADEQRTGFAALTPEENARFKQPAAVSAMGKVAEQLAHANRRNVQGMTAETGDHVLKRYVDRWMEMLPARRGARRVRLQKDLDVLQKLLATNESQFQWRGAKWTDGHDEYQHIDNPIVRLRYDVRAITTVTPARGLNQEIMLAAIEAERVQGEVRGDIARSEEGWTRESAARVAELDVAIARGKQEMREAQEQQVETSQRVLFIEELQPPGKGSGHFDEMPPLFQKNWRELGLKWALRQAAEMGLDGVAWTSGDVQAHRYALTKVMREISWKPLLVLPGKDGPTIEVTLWPTADAQHAKAFQVTVDVNGDVVDAPSWSNLEGQALTDVVGEKIAAQIRSESSGSIEGDQLNVGGYGLKRLYDVDLKNAANKLPSVKKAGVQVGEVTVKTRGNLPPQPFIPLTPELKASVLGGQVLFQEEKDQKRGSITIAPASIRIEFLRDADLSTFLHETGHLYLHIVQDLVSKIRTGDPLSWSASQKGLIDDHDKIMKFLGAVPGEGITVEQHEKFARAFEAYLFAGKAPEPSLSSAFSRFRSWLTKIYRTMTTLGVDLNPEIIGVFDRLVASEDAIAKAEIEARMTPIFSTPEQAGMSPIEWQGYQKILQAAHRGAQDAMAARVAGELSRERAQWWKDKKKALREEITEQYKQTPIYRALAFLQRGELPNGMPIPGGEERLSKDAIVEKYGKDRLKTLPLPYVYQVDGGLDPDTAAELLGFTSGDEMLTQLAASEKLEDVVNRDVDARMAQEFGNMKIDGTLRAAAKTAVEENGFEEVLTAELKAITRAARLARPIVTAAKAQVQAEEDSARRSMRRALTAAAVPASVLRQQAAVTIGRIAPKDIQPQLYWLAAQKESVKASKAVAAGKYEDAVAAKSKQRTAIALHREALASIEEAEKLERYAKRMSEKPAQSRLGKAGESYQTQVNALLNKYEFAEVSNRALERRKNLAEWVADRQREGLPIELPADVLEAALKRNYRTVPMDELREVRDAIKQIDNLARLKNELLSSKDKKEFEAERDRLVASILAKNKTRAGTLEFRRAEERAHTVADWFGSMKKISTLAEQLDGFQDGGPMWELFIRPLNDAADAEVTRRQKEGARYNEILKKHYPGAALGEWNQKRHIPAIRASLSKEAILAVALNWGNETSRDRILSDPKRRWDRRQVEAILDQLDERDWRFVQETWDYIDSFWQEISDKQFRLTGLHPEKVERVPVDTKFGRFRGGYYPLAYDQRLAPSPGVNNLVTDAKQALQAASMRATTRRGHTKTRLEHVELPVRLDVGVLFAHLDQVIHDLTHHEALIDVSRMLRDRTVSQAIHDVGGDVMFSQFTNAITDIALGKRPGGNVMDRAASFMKTGTQISALGFNLWTAFQQPLGLFNGAARIGPTWVARGMFRWMRDAATMENTVKWIRDVSPFMASRSITANQDINDLRNRLSEPGGWFDAAVRRVSAEKVTQQNVTDAFLWHIGLAQRVADVPTWLGAYEKAKHGNKSDDDAVALADQAVRDSQGSGQIVDLAQVQRGGPIARLFMTFYSYGNTVYNATARAYGETEFKNPVSVARFMGNLSLLYFFPAVGTVMLSRLFGMTSGDDDEPFAEWVKDVAAEMGASALNTMVFVRELGGLVRQGNRGYSGPAGTRLLSTIFNLGAQASQGVVDEGLLKALNATAGILFRYPAAQAQRTVDGFAALMSGETQNPAALLFGPERKAK